MDFLAGKVEHMNNFLIDLRFGWRLFHKNPGFYLVIVFTLALGISANTAIFSIFNTILLRPLPFKNPDRLVALWKIVPQFQGRTSSSVPNILDWKSQSTVFESMAAYNSDQVNFHDGGEPERIQSQQISEGYFSLLGIQPKLGRVFLPQEHGPGQTRQVILSHRFWQNRLGGKSDILGQTVQLDGAPHTIVGVMPELNTVDQPELWLPMHLDRASDRGNFALSVIARLKPGVSLDQARAELSTISKRLEQQYPATNKGIGVQIFDLHVDLFGESYQTIWTSFWTLMAAVVLVLLIGCTNIANLLLSHAGRRQKEIAVRIALGAQARDVLKNVLRQGIALILIGSSLGLIVSFGLMRGLASFLYGLSPTDPMTYGGVSLLLILVALAACYLPARRATRVDPLVALRYE
jgi:putative ABC transport system permease protein